MSDAGSRAGSPARDTEPMDTENALHNEPTTIPTAHDDVDSDQESIMSEIEDQELADYDPAQAQLESRPVEIDEDIARTLKASKKKRADGEAAPKKPKERRREKRPRPQESVGSDSGDGKRPRRNADSNRAPARDKPTQRPEDDEVLTPEERRSRALNRVMDAAMKNPIKRRRKKDEVDLEDAMDEQVATLKLKMIKACEHDNKAKAESKPALLKLKLLPQVVALMSRENAQNAIIDPEGNFLQAVKFYLEPLNQDASLPAYSIQRDILSILLRLPIEKDALQSSGLGKIILHYTRSRQPQPEIKRMAEKLVEEWSRPILKRSHDFRKRHIEEREFDADTAARARAGASQMTLTQRPAAASQRDVERARMLAPVVTQTRAQISGVPATYTIAPKSNVDYSKGGQQPIGAGGIEAFRKMTQKKKRG